MVKMGFTNLRSACLVINGIIAITDDTHIETDVASAEPTTSILQARRKKLRSPSVKRLQNILIIMLVLTNPLIRR